jgi:hypothetical protein
VFVLHVVDARSAGELTLDEIDFWIDRAVKMKLLK